MIKLEFDPYIAGLLISMAQNSFAASADAIQVSRDILIAG